MRKLTVFSLLLILALALGGVQASEAVDIDALIVDLVNPNFVVSSAASEQLVKIGPEVIPTVAEKVLTSHDWSIRFKGVTVLRNIGAVEGLGFLLQNIDDENNRVSNHIETAINEIVERHGEAVIPVLAKLLVVDNVTIRSSATNLLVEFGWTEPELKAVVLESLAAAEASQRVIAIDLLEGMAYHSRTLYSEIAPLVSDPASEVRLAAVQGLANLGFRSDEIYEEIEEQLIAVDEPDLDLVVPLLAQMVRTDHGAAQLLINLVKDEEQATDLRKAAYHALETVVPQMEYHLDRGLVAIKVDNGVYLSWRLLGIDPYELGFNLYRDGVRINQEPIITSTNFLDSEGTLEASYSVEAVFDGVVVDQSAAVEVLPDPYIAIPLDPPEGGRTPDGVRYSYNANDASAADLDGDGEYEIILKWDPTNAKDNAHSGYTGNVYLDAYKLDGTRLWRIDLGRNIRAGAHYTQFMVYDFDGDGRAEMAVKTADGTVDGLGNVIGDPDADYRNSAGYVLDGPEFLTMFDGLTGEALDTIDYHPPRGNVGAWGDNYGNRVDRFLAGVAYLDGVTPSLIMARGYYTRAVIAAYNWIDGKFAPVWVMDSDNPGFESARGQGNHQLSIADVDNDGKDEIIYGAVTIDDDGTILYSTGLGHGDALHVTDIDPNRPGLEVFGVHEEVPNRAGVNVRDARTGEILWGVPTDYDVGRGISVNIDPRYPGNENWASRQPLRSAQGEVISNITPNSTNHAIWWDGDLLRELLDHTSGMGKIDKWDWENQVTVNLVTFARSASNNGTKGNPSLTADILGDWREEAIFRNNDNRELRIYLTTDLTEHRLYTFMHDRQYRVAIAWQNTAYNQPPHPSFYVGPDMEIPRFNIGQATVVLEEYRYELGN